MRVLLIVFLILLTQVDAVAARKRAVQKISTEGNHTTSNNNLSKTFTLKDLREGKPLVIVLKQMNGDQSKSVNVALSNRVNVTISDDHNQQVKCEFTRMHHMCYLKSVLSPSATKVTVQCSKSPCDELFEAVQSDIFEAKQSNETAELQAIYNVDKNNSIVSLSCNDSALDQYKESIRIFANASYDIIDRGPLLYVIFQGPLKELLILSTDKVRKCSHIKFTQNLETVQFGKVMRAYITKSRTLKINNIPNKELRVDASAMEINEQPLKLFNITFYGLTQADKESNRQKLELFTIKDYASADQPTVSLDFNMIIKNRKLKDVKQMEMVIDSEQHLLLLLQFNDEEKHEMDAEEQSYFSLEKGEKLDYKIIGNNDAEKDQAVSINVLLNSSVEYNTSETPCRYSSGCSVTVTAKEDISTVLTTTLGRQKVKDISYLDLNQSLALSLSEGEIKYLIHNQSSTKNKIIRVSSPNVIVYASREKCPQPSSKCYQFSGSFKKTINIENHTGPIYISVEGLQLVRFAISIADTDSMVELRDGVATPVNMQKDKEVYLRFRIDKKRTVNFNLIAPVNAFAMYVSNSEEMPDSEDLDLATSSSFLKINEDEVDQLVFTILIKRLIDRQDERFTIIASTDHATIMLDRAQPHYDLLEGDQSRSFVALVNPQDLEDDVETILSISIFQKTQEIVNLTVTFSGPSNDSAQEVQVVQRDTILNLNTYADQICDQQEDEQSCDVFITVVNHNKQKLDITLTILINNSIVELKPGVWQRYEMTSLTSSTHFYFYPNNKKYPVTVQFSHTFAVYKLAYNLWNNELKETNPGLWPYPNPISQPVAPGMHTSEYTIHPEQIAKCFPNCVLLISLWNANEKPDPNPNIVAPIFNNFGSYSIMATDNIIELLEEHKLAISLSKNQSKYLLVSITPYLDTNKTLTFICSDMVGYHSLLVSVSSNKNMTLPTEDNFDWRFELFESQLTIEIIKKRLAEKGMDTHEQIDLILYAKGYMPNKFIFEFSSKDDFMQKLTMGIPQPVIISANQERVFTVDYFLQYRVKLIRRKGFPYLTYKACQRNNIPDCLEEMRKTKAIQITSKADEFRSENCDFCVLIIKIEAKDDSVEADIIALDDASSVQLSEGTIITDFAMAKEINQYKLSIVKGVDAIITLTVFQGDPKVTAVNSFQGINITGKRSGNIIRMVVNSALFEKKQKLLNLSYLTQNYALSKVFSELTVMVTDEKLNCSYSIVYTVGERHIDILDGVLVSDSLKQNENVSYSYHNWQNSTAIVSLSFNDTQMLQNCEVVIHSYNVSDEKPVKTRPEKMEIHKKTPKPSLTFSLDENYSDYQIILRNKEKKDISFNLTVNHVDIVLLPFDYAYPSSLAANESAYFLVEVFNDGYIYFTVKKCADSDLMFSYALDDNSFETEDYAFSTTIEENTFTSFVHVKASTIYIKINSDYGMLYSIKASWFPTKKDVPKDSVKPGNKGFVDYEISGVQEATVTFSPIVCNSSHCPKAEYYYLTSSNRDQVLSQTECPSSFFLFTQLKPLKPQHIKPEKGSNNTYQFKLKMPKELTYLGIKAILDDGKEVTYNVIEVATIWGSLEKNKHYHASLVVIALFCCCFCLCMRFRRSNRDGKGRYTGVRANDP